MDEKIIWSICFVLFLIILCIVKPNIGRIFLGIFYLIMAIGINIVNAITDTFRSSQFTFVTDAGCRNFFIRNF